ncbi:MAG: lipoprotein NlpI [Bacteroidetes bacterium]|nr:lipoprotein NlpI [Bacteroidota bacterium]
MEQKNTQAKKIRIAALVILMLFPLIYLFYKTKGLPENALAIETATVQAPSSDIAVLEKAVAEKPTFDNLVNLSMAYINNKMPGKSIDHLDRAIELNPTSAIAYNNLGVAYTMMQQYQNGIDACTKALQLDSTFQLAKNNLKWAGDEKRKVLEAIKTEEQIPQNKRDVAFWSEYGLNYFKIGEYDKSIEAWNKIFELDVKNTGALNSIGTAFMMKKQVDDAIALYKKALELEPGNQLAKNNFAWALEEKEKTAK